MLSFQPISITLAIAFIFVSYFLTITASSCGSDSGGGDRGCAMTLSQINLTMRLPSMIERVAKATLKGPVKMTA